jgi:uncharacterized protein
MIERFEVESGGLKIRGLLTVPENNHGPYPCVVLSHGLVSSKESSKHIAISEALEAVGIGSCRFDYHGCGESEGVIEETTLTTRIDNLRQTTGWIRRHRFIDGEKIGLLGSSFGGSTSLVVAARDSQIKCISLWATPYLLESKEDDSVSGIEFEQGLFEDFARYDLLSEARKVSRGLVIHGEMDSVVSFSEGRAIYENLREPKRFELMEGGDHVFSDDAHRERAISLAVEWFRRFLLLRQE